MLIRFCFLSGVFIDARVCVCVIIIDPILFCCVQLVDITGKDQDESMIALHDCNGDVNRAINVLLEGSPDTVSYTPPPLTRAQMNFFKLCAISKSLELKCFYNLVSDCVIQGDVSQNS